MKIFQGIVFHSRRISNVQTLVAHRPGFVVSHEGLGAESRALKRKGGEESGNCPNRESNPQLLYLQPMTLSHGHVGRIITFLNVYNWRVEGLKCFVAENSVVA